MSGAWREKIPWALRVTRACLTLANPWYERLRQEVALTQAEAHTQSERFWLKSDEPDFARTLLLQRPKFWLFRCDQKRACGDFVVVDMASPLRDKRRAYVLDLKLGAALKEGGGGAGVQLRHALSAVADIASRYQVIQAETPYVVLTGDGTALLARLGLYR